MKQVMNTYTQGDLEVWSTLFKRQEINLSDKACSDYLKCLAEMKPVLNGMEIPEFSKINDWFMSRTGWKIEVVKGLIPVEEFFELLAQKKFCSSTWLRSMNNLDYIEEPDMFHDTFGHIPLLANPVFSEFAFQFGKLGMKHKNNPEALLALQRLYWYTIEFGLIKDGDAKVYGAGIISSFGETNRALSKSIIHLDFAIDSVLQKPFNTDVMQEEYVIIQSFDDLFKSIEAASNSLNKLYNLARK